MQDEIKKSAFYKRIKQISLMLTLNKVYISKKKQNEVWEAT
jgi:hypothetical protein